MQSTPANFIETIITTFVHICDHVTMSNNSNSGTIDRVQPIFIMFKYINDDITTNNSSNDNNPHIYIIHQQQHKY